MNKKFVPLKWAVTALSTLSIGLSTPAFSQDDSPQELEEVVVTGTKFDIPVEKSGKTIYKLDEEAIQRNAGKTVADLLNEVPGIQMDGNFSSPGTNLSYFVRGGSSKNTLILIDGVPLNDPSGINSTFDLRLLSLDQVESIEVLKGGLSTLYGTGASAAVINIKLKESKENKAFGGSADFSVGSFQTYKGALNLQGASGKFNYMLSGNLLSSEGFSSASDAQSPTPFEKDGLDRKNALLKMGYQFSDQFSLDFLSGYDGFESDYDGGEFIDADNQQIVSQFRVGLTPTYSYQKGSVKLKSVFNTSEREFISSFPSESSGRNLQLDLVQEHRFSPALKGLWGVNLQQFSYEQTGELTFEDNRFTLVDPYLSLFYETNSGWNLHAGARLNTHSTYDSKFIYNLNPSYLLSLSDKVQVKFLASIASAYITPTLFQINSPNYGNPDLKPEESLNYEGGASLYLGDQFTLNTVYFIRDESNPIDFVSLFDEEGNYIGGQYQNTDAERKVQGFEADFTWAFNDRINLVANYAHVSSDRPSTFYRIPKNKWGLTLNASPLKNTLATLKYHFTGERTIYDWASSEELTLDSYGLVDLFVQQSLLDRKLNVYGAVNNLLDEDFVGVYGYTTRGRNFSLGARYQF